MNTAIPLAAFATILYCTICHTALVNNTSEDFARSATPPIPKTVPMQVLVTSCNETDFKIRLFIVLHSSPYIIIADSILPILSDVCGKCNIKSEFRLSLGIRFALSICSLYSNFTVSIAFSANSVVTKSL